MGTREVIEVAAVIVWDERGRMVTVRKRGTTKYMSPGGKPEPGETFAQTAVRELSEELGLTLDPAHLRLLGVFTAPAANEDDCDCRQTLFEYDQPIRHIPEPAAEIDEVRVIDPTQPLPEDVAPLLAMIVPQLATLPRITLVSSTDDLLTGHFGPALG